jgi:hypothetical protein
LIKCTHALSESWTFRKKSPAPRKGKHPGRHQRTSNQIMNLELTRSSTSCLRGREQWLRHRERSLPCNKPARTHSSCPSAKMWSFLTGRQWECRHIVVTHADGQRPGREPAAFFTYCQPRILTTKR